MPTIYWAGSEAWWSPTNGTAATTTAYLPWVSATATMTATTATSFVSWSGKPVWISPLRHLDQTPAQTISWHSMDLVPRYSPPHPRRHHALAERYAREAEATRHQCRIEADAALMLERQHAQIAAHSDQSNRRARELLREHLTSAQRETLESSNWFIVEARGSYRRYRVHARGSLVANVEVLDSRGRASHRLCAHCDLGAIPLADQLLAQKLMLEYDETAFLQIANRHAA